MTKLFAPEGTVRWTTTLSDDGGWITRFFDAADCQLGAGIGGAGPDPDVVPLAEAPDLDECDLCAEVEARDWSKTSARLASIPNTERSYQFTLRDGRMAWAYREFGRFLTRWSRRGGTDERRNRAFCLLP